MKKVAVFCIAILFVSSPLFAADNLLERVKNIEILHTLLPQSQALEARDLGTLIEVVAKEPNGSKQIFYLTPDGTKLIAGGAVFTQEKVNLTQQRFEEVNRVDMSKLSLDDAIRITKGNGAKKLVMFDDVDCPFCRKAMDWLKGQDNYTLYIYLFPLDMHPKSSEKSVSIFCGKDPAAAMELAESDKDIGSGRCDAGEQKLARHKALAVELGINATPVFITETGSRIMGLQPAQLDNYLRRQ